MPSVFICHSSKDKFFARKLAEKLIDQKVTVWIDEAELKIGDSLIEKIAFAIDDVDYIAAILSHNSITSPWVQRELNLAMTKEIYKKQVSVLPILIEKCELPSFLKDKLYADFTNPDNFEGPFLQLLRALHISIPTEVKSESEIQKASVSPVIDERDAKLVSFVDIKIVGLDKSKLYKPDPRKLLYHVYLGLSADPPMEWVEIFEAERSFPRHTMWRKAWIEGRYIVIHCVPEEMKKYHLKDLEEDVSNSNRKFREYLIKEDQRNARLEDMERKEKQELDDAFDGLEF